MSGTPLLFYGLPADAWSAIGQVASAVIAAIGLPFIWYQLRQGRKANDLQNLHSFLNDTAARDQALHAIKKSKRELDHHLNLTSTPVSSPNRDVDFKKNEIELTIGLTLKSLANLAEIEATALRGGLYPPRSRRVVRAWVIDFCVTLELLKRWDTWLEQEKFSNDDFKELKLFRKKHRKIIETRVERQRPA